MLNQRENRLGDGSKKCGGCELSISKQRLLKVASTLGALQWNDGLDRQVGPAQRLPIVRPPGEDVDDLLSCQVLQRELGVYYEDYRILAEWRGKPARRRFRGGDEKYRSMSLRRL